MAELNDKGKKVFALKYSTGKTKTWKESCRKIADFIAEGDRPYGATDEQVKDTADKYFEFLYELYFIPGGRIIANAGTGIKNLANCFVLPIEDSRQSIYGTLQNAAEVFAMGGGVGYDFSNIREEGAFINSTGGKASGPLSFMSLFDQTGEVIQQASRRGAQIGLMDVSHPDIEKFIGFKSKLNARNKRLMQEYDRNLHVVNGVINGTKYERILEKTLLDDQLTHFNISVSLTDDFMKAVENDEDWNLISPSTNKPVKTVRAKEILQQIAEQAWESADPGILITSRINADNIVRNYMGVIKATNPCFTYENQILTKDGYFQIGSLENKTVEIIDSYGNVQVGKIWKSGNKNVVQLRLSNKQIIKCTPNHILMDIYGEEVEAGNSKGVQLRPFLNYKKLNDTYVLYGFIQGDGDLGRLKSVSHAGIEVNIGKNDKDILRLVENRKFTVGERTIYLQDIKNELISLGFSSEKLPNRTFPNSYDSWSLEEKASFLRGCFSANGTINNYARICYKATSREFINKLKETLELDFGINSFVTTNKSHDIKFSNGTYTVKESYDLNISEFESKVIFNNEINFYQDYKIEKLANQLLETSPYVTSVRDAGFEDVYDFSLPEVHWGVVNGFIAHNCGEVPLMPYESCILASINLHSMYNKKSKSINYDLLKDVVRTVTRFLENVTEVGEAPVEKINETTKGLRRLGLGVLGWADLLVELNMPYDSKEAIELAEYMSWFIGYHSWIESFELAKERGAFKFYDKDKVDFHIIKKTLYDNPYEVFEVPFEELKEIGVRNVAVQSLAPTGSIAIIGGVNSSIEPFFALAYKRNITEGIGNIAVDSLFETNPALDRKLKEFNFNDEQRKDILEYVSKTGSIKNCVSVPEEVQNIFKTANEIHWKDHIATQAAWQTYVSNAISKTINIPESSTAQDIYDIYMYMWKSGLKGGTIYRDNSKSFQILEKPKE